MHDIVIRNGTIVDGTGAPSFVGDVAIDGDKINVFAADCLLAATSRTFSGVVWFYFGSYLKDYSLLFSFSSLVFDIDLSVFFDFEA